MTEDTGLAPPPIDDPDVKKEIVLGLKLRKKALEKLSKSETDNGISSNATDARLRLHARGIMAHFTEDTEGTMFEAVYPLKELREDTEDPIVLRNEEEATIQLLEWALSPDSEPVDVEKWIDANGKVFHITLHTRIESSLAPREIKALDDAVAELAGEGTPTTDINEERRRLASLAIEGAGAMKVTLRERILSYLRHLDPATPEFREFVDAWIDTNRSLDMKPIPPKDWEPPVMTEKTYEQLLDDWLEAVGQKITPAAKLLLIEWEVPTQYLQVKDDVEVGKPRPKMKKEDVEDARNRWVNETGTQDEADVQPKELEAVKLGKGKSSHLMISDAEREKVPETDYYATNTLCGRDLGEGVHQSEVQALDDCCKNCVRVHDTDAKGFRLSWYVEPGEEAEVPG